MAPVGQVTAQTPQPLHSVSFISETMIPFLVMTLGAWKVHVTSHRPQPKHRALSTVAITDSRVILPLLISDKTFAAAAEA